MLLIKAVVYVVYNYIIVDYLYRFGRKKIFCISAVAQLILSVGVAFLNNYWVFIATTYVYGIFGSSGSYISGFVLSECLFKIFTFFFLDFVDLKSNFMYSVFVTAMELVGPSKRSVCGILFQTIFASGIMAVSVWGYFIRNTFVLQIIYALHSLMLIPHFW